MNQTAEHCHQKNPLHAKYYPDHALQRTVEIVENVRLARDTYRLRIECPEIAERIVPGQFLMIRISGCNDPLIGRPLALYDTVPNSSGAARGIDVVYLAKGKFTTRLANSHVAAKLDVWGPLGNGFLPQPCETLIMVAGGIGQTPFMALGREALGLRRYGNAHRNPEVARKVILCYGARNAEYLAGLDDFDQLGIQTLIATDDGTRGYHGLVTQLLARVLTDTTGHRRIVSCGPEPMMAAVSRLAVEAGISCQVSLETPMACGIGICFTCVAKVRDETGEWDYKRTCVEGPVFDAAALEW
jgi:dihydroorotate dehydrogenase electron transfer subunit